MDNNELNDRLEDVRQLLTVAYTGQKTDGSWMRPMLADESERRIHLQTAICEVDRIMVELKKETKDGN